MGDSSPDYLMKNHRIWHRESIGNEDHGIEWNDGGDGDGDRHTSIVEIGANCITLTYCVTYLSFILREVLYSMECITF